MENTMNEIPEIPNNTPVKDDEMRVIEPDGNQEIHLGDVEEINKKDGETVVTLESGEKVKIPSGVRLYTGSVKTINMG